MFENIGLEVFFDLFNRNSIENFDDTLIEFLYSNWRKTSEANIYMGKVKIIFK